MPYKIDSNICYSGVFLSELLDSLLLLINDGTSSSRGIIIIIKIIESGSRG